MSLKSKNVMGALVVAIVISGVIGATIGYYSSPPQKQQLQTTQKGVVSVQTERTSVSTTTTASTTVYKTLNSTQTPSTPEFVRITGNLSVYIQNFNATPAFFQAVTFVTKGNPIGLGVPPCVITKPVCKNVNMTQLTNSSVVQNGILIVYYTDSYSISVPNNEWYYVLVTFRLPIQAGNQSIFYLGQSLPLYTTASNVSGYNISCDAYNSSASSSVPYFRTFDCYPQ